MKRLIPTLLVLVQVAGCATLGLGSSSSAERTELWAEAQNSLANEEFARAEMYFERLARDHADSLEGRESLFYLGTIRIDPRNRDWDSTVAEERLDAYLSHMDDADGPRLYRYPEAQTLHEIARQLNLPPESRVAGLQPGERERVVVERVLAPAQQSRELAAEVERLRQQVVERDARIRQQQEELERIRRTLTGPGRTEGAPPAGTQR